MVLAFERDQVEYDIGCEDILARHGSVASALLRVGQRDYRTVVLGPHTENINAKTMDLLERFVQGGGGVLCCGDPPALIDGAQSDRGQGLAKAANWKRADADAVPAILLRDAKDGFAVRRADGDKGILFHHRRHLRDGQLLFLVNTSIESASSGSVDSRLKGVEQWDLHTGNVAPYPFEATSEGVRSAFELPPSGSLLLFLSKEKRDPVPAVSEKTTKVEPAGAPEIRCIEPNVLVLDYVDVTAGGETKTNTYVYQASQFAFQKNGMDRNPWDSAVQFRDALITKKFPADSGLEATYRFTIQDRVPATLFVVIERPDLYAITCNGKAVSAANGAWWLDKAFGKIDIAAAARVGENEIVLKASPFTIYHELESAYVLGDFALQAGDKGFTIAGKQKLRLGPWNEQGHPFYSAGVAYVQKFNLAAPSSEYRVSLPRWYGSVAKVVVNGKPAGLIGFPPWQCSITDLVRAGTNTVEVVIIGTLKNTLGPHHGKPGLGTAWPAMFHKAPNPGPPPGKDYSTVGYGLREPFTLLHVTH